SLTARMLGKRWHEYNPPSILHWFVPREIEELGSRIGLTPIGRGRPPKLLLGSYARHLLSKQLEGIGLVVVTPALKLIPNSWVIPYPGDDIFWILLGHRDDTTSDLG